LRIPLYQVDAFAGRVFAGNPAAVCPLESWLPDVTMQAIASENNLAMTAFFVGGSGRYDLRWFTPLAEVDLCGHATLATALIVFQNLEPSLAEVHFETKSGTLAVARDGERLALDFPSRPPEPCPEPPGLFDALGAAPRELLKSRDYMAVFESEVDVRSLRPEMERLRRIECFGVIATAPGREVDFVSRFFAPAIGIPEDPVTGSAHCTLTPYWSRRLGKTRLGARQLSARGGELACEQRGERVRIAGRAVLYLEGTITL
jgi:PhzF family phenazine biosynthesis protein